MWNWVIHFELYKWMSNLGIYTMTEKFEQGLGWVVDVLKAYLDVIKMQSIVICIKLCFPYSQTYLGQSMHSLLVSSPRDST